MERHVDVLNTDEDVGACMHASIGGTNDAVVDSREDMDVDSDTHTRRQVGEGHEAAED